MTDAVVLLAISQLICLAGLGYLYARLRALQRELAPASPRVVRRTLPLREERVPPPALARPHHSPAPAAAPSNDLGALVTRMNELGVDIPALARRMRRSEDEIRMLLRDEGVIAR